MPVTDPELCHRTPYAFRRYGCAVSRARTLRCFPPPARVLAPSLLSFRPTLRSSLSAPGRMHEHTSADGLRVLRLQNNSHLAYLHINCLRPDGILVLISTRTKLPIDTQRSYTSFGGTPPLLRGPPSAVTLNIERERIAARESRVR